VSRPRRRRLAYAAPPRPVYESSFWTSKEVDETSRNRHTVTAVVGSRQQHGCQCNPTSNRGAVQRLAETTSDQYVHHRRVAGRIYTNDRNFEVPTI